MDYNLLRFLYQNSMYLDYLRYHPKWYPILDSDPSNLNIFINEVKKDLKMTTYDKIEGAKQKITFLSSMINYFTEKN